MMKSRTKIDRKKVCQIVSVYVLALVCAVICGNGGNAKATADSQKQEIAVSK